MSVNGTSAIRRALKRTGRKAAGPVAKLLRPFGYEVLHRSQVSLDARAVRTVAEPSAYRTWSTPQPIWTPWMADPEFRAVHGVVQRHTVVSPDRCHVLWSLARHARRLPGAFAECGVYRGGTALLLAEGIRGGERTLHLFDSFQGLPEPHPDRDNVTTFESGTFGLDSEAMAEVRGLLSDAPCRVELHPGWIPETLTQIEGEREFALVHVDVDFYEPTRDCCAFFYPRMVAGGVMVFDDYGFPATRGEKEAADDFFADKPEVLLPLRTGQAIVVKLPEARAS